MEVIKEFINQHKKYEEKCHIAFFNQDYSNNLNTEPVDLIISQFAGFVGQATKRYLKNGGILLCNDSHGDATLARFDNDLELIGVVINNRIIEISLEKYFVLSKGNEIDLDKVKNTMKGPKYKIMAENYIFRQK